MTSQVRTRLFVESLEDRANPAATVTLLTDGTLNIQGTANRDQVTILENAAGKYEVQIPTSNGLVKSFAKTAVKRIAFHGGDGADTFICNIPIPCTAYGEGGNDVMSCSTTGAARDTLYGGKGDDTLSGGDGADAIYGEDGTDTLNGNTGDDSLYGGNGADMLNGNLGNDMINGGSGSDTLKGGDGNDTLYGYEDNDTLQGGAGNDVLRGAAGNDHLQGDAGTDQLFGEDGIDVLEGGKDGTADSLTGGTGGDTFTREVVSGKNIEVFKDFGTGADIKI